MGNFFSGFLSNWEDVEVQDPCEGLEGEELAKCKANMGIDDAESTETSNTTPENSVASNTTPENSVTSNTTPENSVASDTAVASNTATPQNTEAQNTMISNVTTASPEASNTVAEVSQGEIAPVTPVKGGKRRRTRKKRAVRRYTRKPESS